MSSKPLSPDDKREGADRITEPVARAKEISFPAGDGRCPECGGWRCNGVCQFGGT